MRHNSGGSAGDEWRWSGPKQICAPGGATCCVLMAGASVVLRTGQSGSGAAGEAAGDWALANARLRATGHLVRERPAGSTQQPVMCSGRAEVEA